MKKKIKANESFDKLIEKGLLENSSDLDNKTFDLISTRRKLANNKAKKLISEINKIISSKNKTQQKNMFNKIQKILKIDDTNELLNYYSFKLMGNLKMKIKPEIKFYQIMLSVEHQIEIKTKYNL